MIFAHPTHRWPPRHRPAHGWIGKAVFALLCLVVAASAAHGCRVERTDPRTLTIRGQCEEKILTAHLSAAILELEARGEIGRVAREISKSASDEPKKVDLVTGHLKGGTATFFHRKGK